MINGLKCGTIEENKPKENEMSNEEMLKEFYAKVGKAVMDLIDKETVVYLNKRIDLLLEESKNGKIHKCEE